jgi:ribosomal protein L29
LAQQFQESLGRPFVIDNKAGALGVIGTTEVARSAPDGYTLLLTTNTTQAANLALVKNLPYHPVKDFEPIVRVVSAPMILLVKPDFPALTMKEFLAHAKSRTEGLSGGYGSAASQVSIAKLKTLGRENRDTRQYLDALNRLKTSANQADYVLKDIQSDIDKLFKGRFQEKVQQIDSKVINQEELKKDINELMSLLSEYKSALYKVVVFNDKIKSLGKSETPIPNTNTPNPTNDKPAV